LKGSRGSSKGRVAGLVAFGVGAVICFAATHSPPADGQTAPGDVIVQGEASGMPGFPFGIAGEDGATEAWAWTTGIDGRQLPPRLAPPASPGARNLVLLRRTDGTGWHLDHRPLGEDGLPFAGVQPRPRAARMSPGGSGVLVGPDLTPAAEGSPAVLARDPGGRFRRLPDPPSSVLEPAREARPAEVILSGDRAPVAVFDAGGHATVLIGALGPPVESAVLRWDGAAWSREPLCVEDASGAEPSPPPASCSPAETLATPLSSLRILALSAAGPDDAWLLAEPPASSPIGVLLFRRHTAGGGPRWAVEELPGFEAREPGGGVTALGANSWRLADPLTATTDGVWVDGAYEWGGSRRNFTFFLRDGGGLTSWCDGPAPPCDSARPLEARFETNAGPGYQSFAWQGPGFGTRILTNPIPPGWSEPNGSYLELAGGTFIRRPGGGETPELGAAFAAPDEGWLSIRLHVTRRPEPGRLAPWPLPVRRPLAAVTMESGRSPADLGAEALAVGLDGTVVRYRPDVGWQPEFLLSSTGAVTRPDLRGVAWPTRRRAYAVGELGEIWRWRESLGLWEPDPGVPPNFEGNLTAVAFQPGNSERGFAVGEQGVLLSYGKGWDPEPLPETATAELRSEGRLNGPVDLRAVAFAGSEAIAAAGEHVIVEDGVGWRVDEGAEALLSKINRLTNGSREFPGDGRGDVLAVAGLPDGGAVVAGASFVLVRDGADSAWRFVDQPPGSAVVAVAATREGGAVRPIAILGPAPGDYGVEFPPPGFPAPPLLPVDLPFAGAVARETAAGWRDSQHQSFALRIGGFGEYDVPLSGDPVLALALDPSGEGWAVGGWTGAFEASVGGARAQSLAQTAAVYRYGASPVGGPGTEQAPVPLPSGPTRFVIAGGAECMHPCADQRQLGLGPDRTLEAAVSRASGLATRPGGPLAFLYTGGRVAPPNRKDPTAATTAPVPGEVSRLARLLGGAGLPVFAAVGTGESLGGDVSEFSSAFESFPAPFGSSGGARTHYALEMGGVRMIVIDNSRGSLAASDPHQVPPVGPGGQLAWLREQLAAARQASEPAIVVGHRDLNSRLGGGNEAEDADLVAAALSEGGASAYFYDLPERARKSFVPAEAGRAQLPEYGLGTLGYQGFGDRSYGSAGLGLVEVDVAARDNGTNVAPVRVRMLPLIGELAIEAVDGTLLRRSQPALFRGLGRRPRGGGRLEFSLEGFVATNGSPYVQLPSEPCGTESACPGRLDPEFRFTSSDPDIADFVQRDPASDNQRKPLLDPRTDKPIPDSTSNLLCAFNAGTTTVTLVSGGMRSQVPVTVQQGSVQRPCGTVPLHPSRFVRRPATEPSEQPEVAQPPPPAPGETPIPEIDLPPPPPPASPAPAPLSSFVPPAVAPVAPVPVLVPLTSPPTPRPIPPSGTAPVTSPTSVVQPAAKVQKEEEEELAPEHQQSAVRYDPDGGDPLIASLLTVAALAAALSFAGLRHAPRWGGRRRTPAFARVSARPRRR
jgi:hypothetical protein